MKSNYPRASDHPHVEAKPRVLPYSVGLGLVSFLMSGINLAISAAVDPSNGSVSAISVGVVSLSAIVVLSFAVIILWKCSQWSSREKAKLITITAVGSWALMCAISLGINSPRPPLAMVAPMFGTTLLVFFALLTVAATAIWSLAAAARWFEARLKAKSAEATLEEGTEVLAPSPENVVVEPQVVTINS